MERKLDRRLLVKGLLGIAGAGALAVIVPRQAEALVGLPPDDLAPDSNAFPELEKFADAPGEDAAPLLDEGIELASHRRRRRRRRRRRHWRRYCRREWWNGYYRRRCRRRRVWIWFWT